MTTRELPPAGRRADFFDWVIAVLPLLVAAAPFGLLVGALGVQKGLSAAEMTLMSLTTFAGASQFVAVEMWTQPVPVLGLAIAVFVVNLRHVLMSAAIAPHMRSFGLLRAMTGLFFLTDESWAFALRRANTSHLSFAYYMGLCLPLYGTWATSTVVGAVVGGVVDDPARFGFDFVFVAIMLCLASGFWQGRRSVLPWLVSGAAAILAHQWLPGVWYVIIGALAGSIVGALQPGAGAHGRRLATQEVPS
jgi:predicted branched-subunit amino acid permease